MDLDLNHAAFMCFDGFGFFNFCLPGCGLDLIFFSTSSQLSLQFLEYKLLYLIC